MIQTSNKFDIFIRKNITQFIFKTHITYRSQFISFSHCLPWIHSSRPSKIPSHISPMEDSMNGIPCSGASLLIHFFYLSGSIAVYGIVQIAIFAISIQYSLHTLQKIDILSNRSTWILTCIFALSPTFLMYNELYSSDVIFSILTCPLTTMLIYIWKTKGKILSQIPFTISLTLLFLYHIRIT